MIRTRARNNRVPPASYPILLRSSENIIVDRWTFAAVGIMRLYMILYDVLSRGSFGWRVQVRGIKTKHDWLTATLERRQKPTTTTVFALYLSTYFVDTWTYEFICTEQHASLDKFRGNNRFFFSVSSHVYLYRWRGLPPRIFTISLDW